MGRALSLFAAVVFWAGSLAADTLENTFYRADLSPGNEVLPLVGVSATGRANVALHVRRDAAGNVVSAVVDFDVDHTFGDPVTIRGLHIHDGDFGVNGPVVIDSGISSSNTVAAEGSGNTFRQVNVTGGNALAAVQGILMDEAGYYVNLHTTTFPGGIMRGQLRRVEMFVMRAILDPANEVPAITGLDASGSGSVFIRAVRNAQGVITAATVSFDVSYSFPGPVNLTGLHIHRAPAGTNGGIVLRGDGPSGSDPEVNETGRGVIRRQFEVTADPALTALRDMLANPSGFYLNLHTSDNPGGAMRGQVQATTESSVQLSMGPNQEVPPINGLNASGLAKVSFHVTRDAAGAVTSGTAIFDVNYNFLPGFQQTDSSVEFRGFHIHTAAAGQNGPVVIDSGISSSNTILDPDGAGNIYRIIDVGPANESGLSSLANWFDAPDNHYLNLHTQAHPSGAIRAQLGGTAVPAPAVPAGGIINATNQVGLVAASPGSLISIYGTNLSRSTEHAAPRNGSLPTNLAWTQVSIDGSPIPLLYASPGQINAVVPFEVSAGTHQVTVAAKDGTSTAQELSVSAVSPGIFAVVKGDFSLISAFNPVREGDTLLIFCTGLGPVSPAVATGQLGPATPATTVMSPAVNVAGVAAAVASSILEPGLAGVYRVTATMPPGVPPGLALLALSIDGTPANVVILNAE